MRFYDLTTYLLLTCLGALAGYEALSRYVHALSGGIL